MLILTYIIKSLENSLNKSDQSGDLRKISTKTKNKTEFTEAMQELF